MKNYLQILLIIVSLVVFSCKTDNKIEDYSLDERYIEKQFPYTDVLFYYKTKENSWIREPKNIMMFHETFKKIIYPHFLTDEVLDQTPFLYNGLYYKQPLKQKIDSLVLSYPNHKNAPKYYNEFWTRRINESNDSIVYLVLSEVQEIIRGGDIVIREEYFNPTLNKLIEISTDIEEMTSEKAMDHFSFLQSNKMHQSAYNLLYENAIYSDIDINRDSLEKTLKKEHVNYDTIQYESYSIFLTDNTK